MELLTSGDVAREYGISRDRVFQLAVMGRIGHQIAGHYWVFTREEIEAYRPRIMGKPGRPPRIKVKANETPAGPL